MIYILAKLAQVIMVLMENMVHLPRLQCVSSKNHYVLEVTALDNLRQTASGVLQQLLPLNPQLRWASSLSCRFLQPTWILYPAELLKLRETEESEEDVVPPSRLGPEEERHWIAVRVVDDETGEPLSGVPLKIELPDGRVVTRKTGGDGTAHFSDLDDGTCSIVAMLDEDALEVVSVTATEPEG